MRDKLYSAMSECESSTILLDICVELLHSGLEKESILVVFDTYISDHIVPESYEDTIYDVMVWLTYYKKINLQYLSEK